MAESSASFHWRVICISLNFVSLDSEMSISSHHVEESVVDLQIAASNAMLLSYYMA